MELKKVIPRLIRVGKLEYNGIAGFGYGTDIPEEKERIMEFIYERFEIGID